MPFTHCLRALSGVFSGLLLSCISATILAHPMWILPNEFSLSGDDDQWLSFEASASNTLFAADKALNPKAITITTPDGKNQALGQAWQGKRRSVFDLALQQSGTYRLHAQRPVFYYISYQLNGEKQGKRAKTANVELPPGASQIQRERIDMSTTVYVTRNAPSNTVLTPQGKGVELLPLTHPSDLIVGEAAVFRLTQDGQPLAKAKVELTAGGSRYRDQRGSIELETDNNGEVRFIAETAGPWFLAAETSIADDNVNRWFARFLVFEVMAE